MLIIEAKECHLLFTCVLHCNLTSVCLSQHLGARYRLRSFEPARDQMTQQLRGIVLSSLDASCMSALTLLVRLLWVLPSSVPCLRSCCACDAQRRWWGCSMYLCSITAVGRCTFMVSTLFHIVFHRISRWNVCGSGRLCQWKSVVFHNPALPMSPVPFATVPVRGAPRMLFFGTPEHACGWYWLSVVGLCENVIVHRWQHTGSPL